jgi:hypothetical protein
VSGFEGTIDLTFHHDHDMTSPFFFSADSMELLLPRTNVICSGFGMERQSPAGGRLGSKKTQETTLIPF